VKTVRLYEKITRLRQQMRELAQIRKQLGKQPDKQLSMTDPDARSMATSGRGSGIVGYNVQVAVDTKHHLIVEHEVTNVGNDHGQLSRMALAAKKAMGKSKLKVVADRGYFSGPEIRACALNDISVRSQATDLRIAEERFVHQGRLCLRGKKRCVSMPCWRASHPSIHDHRA